MTLVHLDLTMSFSLGVAQNATFLAPNFIAMWDHIVSKKNSLEQNTKLNNNVKMPKELIASNAEPHLLPKIGILIVVLVLNRPLPLAANVSPALRVQQATTGYYLTRLVKNLPL